MSDAVRYRDGIAAIESDGSGGYSALGANHPKYGYALGRYQIMESNLPQWSKAALGHTVTKDEFMDDPAIQDAIFDHRFGSYIDKYGEEGAARAWYGGEKGMKNLKATDVHGRINVGQYGKNFVNNINGNSSGGINIHQRNLGGEYPVPPVSSEVPPVDNPDAVNSIAQGAKNAVPQLMSAIVQQSLRPQARPSAPPPIRSRRPQARPVVLVKNNKEKK